jgi:hypothetical protein
MRYFFSVLVVSLLGISNAKAEVFQLPFNGSVEIVGPFPNFPVVWPYNGGPIGFIEVSPSATGSLPALPILPPSDNGLVIVSYGITVTVASGLAGLGDHDHSARRIPSTDQPLDRQLLA